MNMNMNMNMNMIPTVFNVESIKESWKNKMNEG